MTDEEFEQSLSSAMDELVERQERLCSEYGLGTHARWTYDQEAGQLDFFDGEDNKVLSASAVFVGTYASDSNTWKWAWANDSIVQSQRDNATSLRALADKTGYPLFAQDGPVEIQDESMAWELAAMSLRHLDAIGVYRAPSSNGAVSSFLAITSIHRRAG